MPISHRFHFADNNKMHSLEKTIKRTFEQTWVGVWPKSSRSGIVSDKGCSEGSSQTI